jgi:hypothetical protein
MLLRMRVKAEPMVLLAPKMDLLRSIRARWCLRRIVPAHSCVCRPHRHHRPAVVCAALCEDVRHSTGMLLRMCVKAEPMVLLAPVVDLLQPILARPCLR